MQRRFPDELIFKAGRHGCKRETLAQSDKAGCYHCLAVFDYFAIDLIKEWVGFQSRALCPKCGVDAVLGSATGYPVTSEVFLREMNDRWFKMGSRPSDKARRQKLVADAREAGKTYTILPAQEGKPPKGMILKPEAIMCLKCGMDSFHPEDISHRYCGNCKMFHEGEFLKGIKPGTVVRILPLPEGQAPSSHWTRKFIYEHIDSKTAYEMQRSDEEKEACGLFEVLEDHLKDMEARLEKLTDRRQMEGRIGRFRGTLTLIGPESTENPRPERESDGK